MRGPQGLLITVIVFWSLSEGVLMAAGDAKTHSFAGINEISITAITGNVLIEGYDGKEVSVEFVNELEQPGILTPVLTSKDGSLAIREEIPVNNPKGSTTWTIRVPRGTVLRGIECQSALGAIHLRDLSIGRYTAHAATRGLNVQGVTAAELALSTSSGDVNVTGSRCERAIKIATSDGDLEVLLPALPERTDLATTNGRLRLVVPSFGDNFVMEIFKNADRGRVIMPFTCTNRQTKRYHEKDTYETDLCTVTRGSGGNSVRLLTGTGTIEIDTATGPPK